MNLFLEFYQNSEEDMASTKDTMTMTKKTKLNPLKPFTGKRTDLQRFIQETFIFLTINKEHYNTDDKKIAFVMSFMNNGDASSWKQEFISRIMKDDQGDDISFRTYKAFMESLEKSFSPYDGPGDALEEMKQLKFTNDKSIDEHVSKFKLLVAQSGLGHPTAIIDLFRETLPYSLQRPIITSEFFPATLDGWFNKAIIFHNNWKKAQRYLRRKRTNANMKQEEPTKKRKRSECHGYRSIVH